MVELQTEQCLRTEVASMRRRLEHIEALLKERQAGEAPTTISSRELAARLGITSVALAFWARNHGVGACRDGYKVIGRLPGHRGGWRWAPVA